MSKPRGVTNSTIVKFFIRGASVKDLATRYRCEAWDIHKAIRDYMKKRRT